MRLRRRPARPDTQAGAHVGGLLGGCSTTPPSSCSPRSTTCAALVPGHPHLTPLLDHVRRTPLARAPAGLRRHLRPHPEVRALPDLLRLRGHPSAGSGAGALQGRLPSRWCRVGRRPRRAPRPPVRGAAVRRHRRSRHRPVTPPRAPCRRGDAAPRAHRVAQRRRHDRVAVGRGAGGPVRHPARARRDTRPTPYAVSSSRARRPRRSASRATPPTPPWRPVPPSSRPPPSP